MHVTLEESVAHSLAQALGTAETVVSISDDPAIGPIDPADAGSRLQWLRSVDASDRWTTARLASPWLEIARRDQAVVVWMSTAGCSKWSGAFATYR